MWNSVKVSSDRSFSIEYAGKELRSRMRYYWKVKIWDELGNPSSYSEPSWWEMGLLIPQDWIAKWIAGGKLFRKSIVLPGRPRKARAYVACIGFYELWINYKRVGDRVLDPAPSAQEKRVYCASYDVGDLLSDGNNFVHVFLGKARQDRNAVLVQLRDRDR